MSAPRLGAGRPKQERSNKPNCQATTQTGTTSGSEPIQIFYFLSFFFKSSRQRRSPKQQGAYVRTETGKSKSNKWPARRDVSGGDDVPAVRLVVRPQGSKQRPCDSGRRPAGAAGLLRRGSEEEAQSLLETGWPSSANRSSAACGGGIF